MAAPLPLSIIVTCRNPGARLSATLDSIRVQCGIALETIVIDRDSTDDTRSRLETAGRSHATAVFLTGDVNVPAALIHGIGLARGEWVLLLEAGDRLVGDRILSEALHWMNKTEAGVVAGETAYDDGRIVKLGAHANPRARNFFSRAAAFYRRSLFDENGAFDPAWGDMADYEFNVRLWKNRVRFKPVPLRIAASDAVATLTWPACRAEIQIRHRYFAWWRCVGWDLCSGLRWLGHAKKRPRCKSVGP